MKNTMRTSILIVTIFLLTLNFAAIVQAKTSLQSVEGVIVVIKLTAMININGTNYLISKENSSYTQFEKRHIKMYDVHLDSVNGYLMIDFTGFRFIDAIA